MRMQAKTKRSFQNLGAHPLDYRSFDNTNAAEDRPLRTALLKRLHLYGGSRLALLFERSQWCFGDDIVDLADLEEIER